MLANVVTSVAGEIVVIPLEMLLFRAPVRKTVFKHPVLQQITQEEEWQSHI
jgi:hypothetical protein